MGKRRQGRELALEVLFELEGQAKDPGEVITYHAQEAAAGRPAVEFCRQLVNGVLADQAELEAAIDSASDHWAVGQMAKVDRIILKIAAYELLIAGSTPVRVVINESIELAKTFSGEESSRFVNGVLGKIAAPAATPSSTQS